MKSPINSIKHYVQKTNSAVASGGLVQEFFAVSVVAPAAATTSEVTQGSVIKAIHPEIWICGDDDANVTSQFTFIIEKVAGGQTAATVTNLLNLSAYPNKKNVLYSSQGVLGSQRLGNQSIPVFRDWLKIPKGKQRMGLGDSLQFSLTFIGDGRVCGTTTYKEYR